MIFVVNNFRAAFFPPLLRCLSKFAVCTLDCFQYSFVLLSLFYIVLLKTLRVDSEAAVGRDTVCCSEFNALDSVVSLLTHVPVTHPIKVEVTGIVTKHLTHNFAILKNFTFKIVTRPAFNATEIVPSGQPILYIFEFSSAY